MCECISLTIAISAYNKTITKLVLPNPEENLKLIIIHQVSYDEGTYADSYSKLLKNRPDVKIHSFNEVGLSLSRNRAIEYADTDYIIFSDDDNHYIRNVGEKVRNQIVKYDFPAFLSFTIEDENGNFFKRYNNTPFKHNKRSILRLSSIENAYNLQFIKNNKISFDENFGLGATYPSCEQPIFASSILSKCGVGYFVPITITYHPLENSGEDFYTNKQALARKKMLSIVYGQVLGRIFYLAFVLRKLKSVPSGFKWKFSVSAFLF
ncbi:glycosyltransferase [Vibrio splendidus]